MEAWRQYRAFTSPPDSRPEAGPSTRRYRAGQAKSPADGSENRASRTVQPQSSSSSTLRDDTSRPGDAEKAEPVPLHPEEAYPPPPDPASEPTDKPPTEAQSVEKPSRSSGTPPTYPSSATSLSEKQEYTYVTFAPDDPSDPQNWSNAYKISVVLNLTWLTLSLTFGSSVSSSAEAGVKAEFGASDVTATAMTGLFLVGMGIGAMPTAPLSELYGRLPVYLSTIFLATLFQIACALAPNLPALLILRFISGLVSSAPLSNAGGTLNDIGNPVSRTLFFPLFTTCGFLAPTLAPIVGGYLATDPLLGWRWCYWITAFFNAVAFVLVAAFMPETLRPALLQLKAIRLRRSTGSKRWRAPVEDQKLWDATVRALGRPFKMLAVEPVVQFFVCYLTVVYIVLYGSFSSYPIVFAAHGVSARMLGLTFIPVMVGFFILFGGTLLHYVRYRKLWNDATKGLQRRGIHDGKVEPEERLIPLMAASICFPAGLFWLAWTSSPEHSVWLTMMSGIPFGIGLLAIFQGSMQYMLDAYGPFAASALAGSTLVRYAVPGLVVLAYPKMYETLGTEWATSLFAFLGLALFPVPFVFYRYGRKVRARCTFTVRD